MLVILVCSYAVEPSMAQDLVAPLPTEEPAAIDSHAEKPEDCDQMTTTEYFGDTTLHTCNVGGRIEVRFMSLGPGGCAVEAREDPRYAGSRPATTGLLALPGIWSGWLVFREHFGRITTRIVNRVHCDTGVRSQVRYYRR